jgi:hypothetical protein
MNDRAEAVRFRADLLFQRFARQLSSRRVQVRTRVIPKHVESA